MRPLKTEQIDREDSYNISAYLTKINVERVSLVAKLTLFFQALNLCNKDIYNDKALLAGVGAVLVLSLAYLVVLYAFKNKASVTTRQLKILYQTYWLLFAVGMTPFFVLDAYFLGVPINTVLFFAVLMAAPIFTSKQLKKLYLFLVVYIVAVPVLCRAGWYYIASVLVIAVAGYLMSYFMHKSYIDLILKLKIDSETDDLTGLLSRKAATLRMKSMLNLCQRVDQSCALYMIDIDFFKKYNDSFGHMEGDKALVMITRTMRRIFCRASDILCRIGGEEFAVLIVVSDEAQAIWLGERLLAAVEELHIRTADTSGGNSLTVSIGLTMFTPGSVAENEEVDLTALMSRADKALYRAKERGRNCLSH